MPDPREWFNRKDLCQRCLSSIDNDHDGDCATCARMTDEVAKQMRAMRLNMTIFDIENRGSSHVAEDLG